MEDKLKGYPPTSLSCAQQNSFSSLRMIRYYLLLLLLLTSCSIKKSALTTQAAEEASYDYLRDSTITSFFEQFPDSTELSLGFYKDGAVEFMGLVKVNGQIRKVQNKDGIFEIGSISKIFTSLLLSHYHVGGELQLNDPLQKYVDFPLYAGDMGFDPSEVSLLSLSNHTSGLLRLPGDLLFNKDMDAANPYAHYTKINLEDHLKTNFYRTNPAGKVYSYSNLGAGLLEYALEKKSQKDYDVLLYEMVFDDLSMSSSGCSIKDSSRLISGRDLNGSVRNWDFASLKGAGAVKSTVNDMMKFIKKNMTTKDEAYLTMRDSTFQVNERMNMGLAWHIIKEENNEYLFHNGGTGGYTSSLVMDIDHKKGIIILSNISAMVSAGKVDNIAFDWMRNR